MAHGWSADPTKYLNTVLYAYVHTSTSRSTKSHMGIHFSPTDYIVPRNWVCEYQYSHIIIRTGLNTGVLHSWGKGSFL
jgi:hypothetical protein